MSTAIAVPVVTTPPLNPAEYGWPSTLPVEIALKTASIPNICAAYHLSQADWAELRLNPRFQADVRRAAEMVRVDGMGFKVKVGWQAEAVLAEIWRMIHDRDNPPSVRADLAKFLVRASGNDASVASAAAAEAARAATLNIQINLG